MLHLIMQTPLDVAVLERIASGDGIVLMYDNVWLACLENQWQEKIRHLQQQLCKVYVLSDDVSLFGVSKDKLLADVDVIDRPQWVTLTTQYSVIKTWH